VHANNVSILTRSKGINLRIVLPSGLSSGYLEGHDKQPNIFKLLRAKFLQGKYWDEYELMKGHPHNQSSQLPAQRKSVPFLCPVTTNVAQFLLNVQSWSQLSLHNVMSLDLDRLPR